MNRRQSSLFFLEEEYLQKRGIGKTGRLHLLDSLREVLEEKPPILHTDSESGLTKAEQKVLKQGGLRLDGNLRGDLAAETTMKFAKLVSSSLASAEVAAMLKLTPSRVRQMIRSREIYSFVVNGRRLIPPFQFHEGALVNNIRQVLPNLRIGLHPVGVDQWFRRDNPELIIDENSVEHRSPIDWLSEGRNPEKVSFLASYI